MTTAELMQSKKWAPLVAILAACGADTTATTQSLAEVRRDTQQFPVPQAAGLVTPIIDADQAVAAHHALLLTCHGQKVHFGVDHASTKIEDFAADDLISDACSYASPDEVPVGISSCSYPISATLFNQATGEKGETVRLDVTTRMFIYPEGEPAADLPPEVNIEVLYFFKGTETWLSVTGSKAISEPYFMMLKGEYRENGVDARTFYCSLKTAPTTK